MMCEFEAQEEHEISIQRRDLHTMIPMFDEDHVKHGKYTAEMWRLISIMNVHGHRALITYDKSKSILQKYPQYKDASLNCFSFLSMNKYA